MISPPQRSVPRTRGLTIIEVTLVIGVMMSLITMLFVAVRAWRVGSDRSKCILNQRQMQVSMRSYQSMYGFADGATPPGGNILELLREMDFINEKLYLSAIGDRPCPAGGIYAVGLPDHFPDQGTLFMSCSFAESRNHEADSIGTW